jgi:hypothetical protein
MTADDFKNVPTAILMQLALFKMRGRISYHKQFLVLMGIAYFTAKEALAEDAKPENVEEALVKQLVAAPGRMTDSRIEKLAPRLLRRVLAFDQRLEHIGALESIELADWRALLKDIKQLDADIEPVYAWHEEMKRELAKATAEAN